jgi:hypothetical protein
MITMVVVVEDIITMRMKKDVDAVDIITMIMKDVVVADIITMMKKHANVVNLWMSANVKAHVKGIATAIVKNNKVFLEHFF